jgi:hypothetical protein
VTDDAGRPVPNLLARDFIIKIDGKSARVERVEWHGTRQNQTVSDDQPGRLIVFLVQRTLNANVARRERDVIALRKALHLTEPILNALKATDRVAVVSLDVHLRVWTDFTGDVAPVRRILQSDVMTAHPENVRSSAGPSLLTEAFRNDAASASTMEGALICVGDALKPLSGLKTLVLLGNGFGMPDALYRSFVETAALPGLLDDRYDSAVKSLTQARVAVISVDVTDARRHALEFGLQTVADETGGIYTRAYPFPELAMKTVADSLEGYYTLSIERPPSRPGRRNVDVEMTVRGQTVQAPKAYFD